MTEILETLPHVDACVHNHDRTVDMKQIKRNDQHKIFDQNLSEVDAERREGVHFEDRVMDPVDPPENF